METTQQLGRHVLYSLTEEDVEAIRRMPDFDERDGISDLYAGRQLPGLITGCPSANVFNVKVFLDAPGVYWAREIRAGTGEGTFAWIEERQLAGAARRDT